MNAAHTPTPRTDAMLRIYRHPRRKGRVTTTEQAATPDDAMTKSKTTIRYHIQAALNGGTWYDTDTKGFTSRDKAERVYDRILRDAYPTWRGLSLVWRVVRRKTTVTADTRIEVFATPSHGKKRSLLGEMFVPSWLPKRQKERLKMRRIPDAPEQWQPTSQLPTPQPENK